MVAPTRSFPALLLALVCAAMAPGCAHKPPAESFPASPADAPGNVDKPFAPLAGPGGDHWVERPPAGWRKLAVDTRYFRYALERVGCRGGSACARIDGTELAVQRAASLSQQFPVGGLAGRRIIVSAWIRQRDVQDWAHLWAVVRGEGNVGLDADRAPLSPVRGDRDWRRVEVAVDVPPEAVSFGVGFVLAGPGTLWIDDVRVTDGNGVTLEVPLRNPQFEDG